jgi:hypothetical protein
LEVPNVGGNNDSEETPTLAFPDKSAVDRNDDKVAPVLGSNNVTQPPPPPGVNAEHGFVVVTLTIYFIFFFSECIIIYSSCSQIVVVFEGLERREKKR